ncbi:MAG: hypothetical protein NC393_13910, partial [Clostridium sp.]|nr:hypothetical protein [Clostridium sp.]
CATCGATLVNGVCPNCSKLQQTTYTQQQIDYIPSGNIAPNGQSGYTYNNGMENTNRYTYGYGTGYAWKTPTDTHTAMERDIQVPPIGYGQIGNNKDYTPIRPWGYVGYMLLFSIPILGQLILLLFALNATGNINVRNFARAYFCILLLLIIILLMFGGVIATFLSQFDY